MVKFFFKKELEASQNHRITVVYFHHFNSKKTFNYIYIIKTIYMDVFLRKNICDSVIL